MFTSVRGPASRRWDVMKAVCRTLTDVSGRTDSCPPVVKPFQESPHTFLEESLTSPFRWESHAGVRCEGLSQGMLDVTGPSAGAPQQLAVD
ncbi:unnamed protein product [Lota lota]